METIIYGSYILIWPVITLVMLGVITRGVVRDYREAKQDNTTLV